MEVCAEDFSRDLVLAAAGSTLSLPAGYAALYGTSHLMEASGIREIGAQSYFHYHESFKKIANPFLRTALKAVSIFYITLFVPILEEWVFRNKIYGWQEAQSNPNKDSSIQRMYRILSNALLFGAFHFNIFHGWANFPVLVVSTIVGVVFAALREITGNYRASTIAHVLNNVVMVTI